MGFKSVTTYTAEKYGNKFILQNDGDYADVVFLYQSEQDVLIADAHYINTSDYAGYVHCTGHGCPACAKKIRVQQKLFIPLYNATKGEIEFWDRTPKFLPQLSQDVFKNYPNPSEFVFRISRNGAAGSIDTRYTISICGNNRTPYAQILAGNNTSLPDGYEKIIRDVDAGQMSTWLNASDNSYAHAPSDLPDYTPTPRVSVTAQETEAAVNAAFPVDNTIVETSDGEPTF